MKFIASLLLKHRYLGRVYQTLLKDRQNAVLVKQVGSCNSGELGEQLWLPALQECALGQKS